MAWAALSARAWLAYSHPPDLGPFSGHGFADGIASQAGIQALGVVTVFVY
ncbi:hypothetical protein [Salinisphaera shabanensis]|nr:hypothetical protein [Salinisphaera shabanensis]